MEKKQLVKKLLKTEIDTESEEEILDMLVNNPISVDVEKAEDATATKGDKIADKVAAVAGSWPFIITFSLFLFSWIIINGVIFRDEAFDDYPFILLNLVLSCIAALQAPVIMMSQNRQAKKDSLRNQNDYQVDLKSELILEDLYEDVKEIKKNQRAILKYIEAHEEKEKSKK